MIHVKISIHFVRKESLIADQKFRLLHWTSLLKNIEKLVTTTSLDEESVSHNRLYEKHTYDI